jgi:CRISPR-associated protein Csd1
MIQELVLLAGRLRKDKRVPYFDDALDTVPVGIGCEIDRKGSFKRFIVSADKKETIAEALPAKKGKARLLVDKPEEVLGFGEKAKAKHKFFREKLEEFSQLKILAPMVAFYGKNSSRGLRAARAAFPKQVEEKLRRGNIAFKIAGDKKWLHDAPEIHKAVIASHKVKLRTLKVARFPLCSICGSSAYPVTDEYPHGMIKRVPEGQTSGCALVSYNENAFESYYLNGNENASICTHCARAYVDALNWLLRPSSWKPGKKGKDIPVFKNRKNISFDTAVVFWLRDGIVSDELDLLDNPDEGKIREMFKSLETGNAIITRKINTDMFYAITLSGSAARIAVRDWIETSLANLRENLSQWFYDIEIGQYDANKKKVSDAFLPFWGLVRAAQSKGGSDVQHGRIGAALWKCALLSESPPLWLLSALLNRIRAEQGNATAQRVALLKLYLNRNSNYKGGIKYMSTLDESNNNVAYTCGRLFAVLEAAQYHASGGNLNAGIRERFFSFASTMPSTAFGRLMKLAQHHLSKIRGEKPGLAVNLDKKIQDLMCRIGGTRMPTTFTLEDQASFAIGYYHQRQHDFESKSNNKEK